MSEIYHFIGLPDLPRERSNQTIHVNRHSSSYQGCIAMVSAEIEPRYRAEI